MKRNVQASIQVVCQDGHGSDETPRWKRCDACLMQSGVQHEVTYLEQRPSYMMGQ